MSLRRIGAAFYLVKLYSILTGALFILLITRNLSVSEFGAWSTISNLLGYAAALTFINFWTTRLRASGAVEATPTALYLSSAFALPATVVYVAASLQVASTFHLPLDALLVSAWYVPTLYANSALYAAALGAKPVYAAASEAAFETVKLLSAVAVVALRRVSLAAALLAVLAGYIAQVAVLAWLMRGDLRKGFSRRIAVRILSLSPANALSLLPPLIGGMDVLLLSAFVSNDAVAYYTVVLPFTNAVSYSYFLARGLYPALLAGSIEGERLIEEAVRLVTLLAIPSSIGAAVTAPYLLYVLRPEYSVASTVLAISAFAAAVSSVGSVFSDAVQGLERRDLEGAGLREMLRSRILRVQLLACARTSAGIALIALIALAVKDPVKAAALCRSAWLALLIVETSILASWARAGRALARASGSALRFTLAALAAAAAAYMIRPMRIRELAVSLTAAALTYFALTYLLDPWFRQLTAKTLPRLRSMLTLEQNGKKG
ncbi:MAG: hypothetical protein QXY39_03210 [Thermofilaceae archaeon]